MAANSPHRIFLIIASVAALVVLLIGGFMLHDKRAEKLQNASPPQSFPWALRTTEVARRDLTAGFPVLATLSSRAEITIMPQISGVIRAMGPREGHLIKKGSLLAKLDTKELENQLAALKASYQAAVAKVELDEKELKRKEKLLKDGYATQEVVDILQTALQADRQQLTRLQAEIEAQSTRVKYGTINSPVDGIVSARLQDPGDLATPGRAIYRITAVTGAKVKITVPQTVAARLHEGSQLQLVHGEQSITVKINRVFPSLDTLSMGSAEADLTSIPFGLPSGARVPGRVVLDQWPDALLVPRTALILGSDGTSATIFRVVNEDGGVSRLTRVAVKIVANGREGVAIDGSVAAGDRVVTAQENELLKLKDGDAVLPQQEQGQ